MLIKLKPKIGNFVSNKTEYVVSNGFGVMSAVCKSRHTVKFFKTVCQKSKTYSNIIYLTFIAYLLQNGRITKIMNNLLFVQTKSHFSW